MESYGMDIQHRTSSRRVRKNHIGNVVEYDYSNNAVFILSDNQEHSVTHRFNFPLNISTHDRYVYIAQDGIDDYILEIQLDDHCTAAILKEETELYVTRNNYWNKGE